MMRPIDFRLPTPPRRGRPTRRRPWRFSAHAALGVLAVCVAVSAAAAGADGDCNGNGVPDRAEIAEKSTHSVIQTTSPFGAGLPAVFKLVAPPVAIGDVSVTFSASADLGAGNERIDVFVDGEDMGEILNSADDCSDPPDQDALVIPAAEWNAFATDEQVVISAIANQSVNAAECTPPSSLTITVTYPILPWNDVDLDGELDVCQSLRQPDAVIPAYQGLAAHYFALVNPSSLPDFDALIPTRIGVVAALNYPSTSGEFAGSGFSNGVGAVFSGYITVPADDFYFFHLESDDGSRLLIGNRVVVDHDGLHGMIEASGAIGLAAGTHAIRVEYFEHTGGAGLIASIEGGGLSKQVIPEAMLGRSGRCDGEVVADDVVDGGDLGALLAAWGPCFDDPCNADLDGDDTVGGADLGEVLGNWGPCPPDIMIESVELSSSVVDSGEVVSVEVGLCSSAETPVESVLLIVNVLGGGASVQTLVDIAPGCTTTETIDISAPLIEAECGTPVARTVQVLIQPIGPDAHAANNEALVALSVVPDYWDLVFNISITPSTVFACPTVTWLVTVTNIGNTTSDPVCYQTGITPDAGPNDWSPVDWSCTTCWTGSIPAGASIVYTHTNDDDGFGGPCLIFGPQYVKVYVDPPCDDCSTGANFDQQQICVLGGPPCP